MATGARVDEIERELGRRLRELRVRQRLTQTELAERANVSVGALKHLESGAGATTTTLVKVLRALGQEGWIDSLGPTTSFNPLDLLDPRAPRRRVTPPRRVRHPRPVSP